YLRKRGRQLDPLARRYLEACAGAPFSFHEVLNVTPGHGFGLRDIFRGTETDVMEKSGSAHARVGDILFGKVVRLDDLSVLDGCSPVAIRPVDKPRIIDLRRAIDAEGDLPQRLDLWSEDLLELYHDLVEPLLNPRPPELQNTD